MWRTKEQVDLFSAYPFPDTSATIVLLGPSSNDHAPSRFGVPWFVLNTGVSQVLLTKTRSENQQLTWRISPWLQIITIYLGSIPCSRVICTKNFVFRCSFAGCGCYYLVPAPYSDTIKFSINWPIFIVILAHHHSIEHSQN